MYISLKAFKKISIMTKLMKVSISSKGWRMGGAYWCKKKKLYKCAEESPSGHRVKNWFSARASLKTIVGTLRGQLTGGLTGGLSGHPTC